MKDFIGWTSEAKFIGEADSVVLPPVPLIQTLQSLGLTDGLKIALDAGDIASWPGSGQSWLDTSGNGYDFFRGADGNASTDDPAFSGTPGGLSASEYWSFDGGDRFTIDEANPAWVNNLHKDAAKVWAAAWIRPASIASIQGIFGNNAGGASSAIGFTWYLSTSVAQAIVATNGSGNALSQNSGGSGLAIDEWHFVAFTLDESVGANGLTFITDGVSQARTSTYATPSESDATHTMQIGARGNNNLSMLNGGRMGMLCMGEGAAPSAAQLLSLREATRGRFGI